VARFRRRLVTTDAAGYVGCCNAVAQVDTHLSAVEQPAAFNVAVIAFIETL
jgi:3-oxoadipate enol-lactonase